MTRDEILQIPAGRVLDALVAEKVMGWKPDTTRGFGWPNGDFYPNSGMGVERITGTTEDDVKTKAWHPSTDIAAAWEVVNELNRKGYLVSMDANADGTGGVSIAKHIIDPEGDPALHMVAFVNADTVPLSICRAALAAGPGPDGMAVMEKE